MGISILALSMRMIQLSLKKMGLKILRFVMLGKTLKIISIDYLKGDLIKSA